MVALGRVPVTRPRAPMSRPVIEVVDNFVYFAVVVACVGCHCCQFTTKISELVFKCLSPFVVKSLGPFAAAIPVTQKVHEVCVGTFIPGDFIEPDPLINDITNDMVGVVLLPDTVL